MIVTKPPTVAAVLALKICKVFQNYQTVSWGFDTEIYVSFIPFIFVLFLVTFGDEVTTILRNVCFHFARHDRQDGKNERKSRN